MRLRKPLCLSERLETSPTLLSEILMDSRLACWWKLLLKVFCMKPPLIFDWMSGDSSDSSLTLKIEFAKVYLLAMDSPAVCMEHLFILRALRKPYDL